MLEQENKATEVANRTKYFDVYYPICVIKSKLGCRNYEKWIWQIYSTV